MYLRTTKMSSKDCEASCQANNFKGTRSRSAQGLACVFSSPAKLPLPPRLWITDVEQDSSDLTDDSRNEGQPAMERSRVRSRYRHYKQRSLSVPIGIFWDIENCQVPRGCSAIDVVSAIRTKFLVGRREADFVVVCDVRKEATNRLQELNDAQVSLIHVCGTQKNAADEKLRQCMRRFGELHSAPAALLLISGDINFAADLSDFRHRKNMDVILVHKQNTSSALIACASSHYCFNELTAHLPRNPKTLSQTEEEEEPTCEMEVANLPTDQPAERVSRRLRRLADNCGGKVLKVTAPTATLRFPTADHASRALKRMDGEDVFGRKISTRFVRSAFQPTYSSDEGYSTAPAAQPPPPPAPAHPSAPRSAHVPPPPPHVETGGAVNGIGDASGGGGDVRAQCAASEWALALQQLPAPTPPPLDFCPPPAPRLRKIRGTHGSANLDRSGCSSNSGDEGRRAASPWNCSGSFSEHSEAEDQPAELTVANLPPFEPVALQDMLAQLFGQYVAVVRVSVWAVADGLVGSVALRSEWDARLAIARVHKRRLDGRWAGRRLELALGRPSPAPNPDILRARLRAILLEQNNHCLPLLRLRDTYASRHCCALTTSDLAKVRDTVVVHDGFGRTVQLVDFTPVRGEELEEAPWKCHIHASITTGQEDGSKILQPVYIELAVLAKNAQILLENHGGVLPLLSFVECYEATFPALVRDARHGVPLELLLRSVPELEVKDAPSRHLTWRVDRAATPPASSHHSDSSTSSDRDRPRTAPALEPMLALFEREVIDLLRSAPRCCIPFSKLIPAFHHHFGRQCRVADYGFTKLPDLLAALSHTILVLGSGSSRIITISAAAQSRRWTSDLKKLLKAQLGRSVAIQDIPALYQATFHCAFSPPDYGVCSMTELMAKVSPEAVVCAEGAVWLPRPAPTPEECARTVQFAMQVQLAMQAAELLCYTPNLHMEFSRFVPAYHAHFGRQLRVAHYGCVKLVELFELIPEAVTVCFNRSGERSVKLAHKAAKSVMYQRLQALAPIPLSSLPASYAAQYGGAPQPEVLGAPSLEALVFACGGSVDRGLVRVPASPRSAAAALAAAAVLAADRSVARGSTQDYFLTAFRHLFGSDAEMRSLEAGGVIETSDGRVRLSAEWRAVWRLACILAERAPLDADALRAEYASRHDPTFCADMGEEALLELLRSHPAVFRTEAPVGGTGGAGWALCGGVAPPRGRELRDLPELRHPPGEDYSLYDTPPGQKGSRVFESPLSAWRSPPASALPPPTALLPQDKRRTRLAAQFDLA